MDNDTKELITSQFSEGFGRRPNFSMRMQHLPPSPCARWTVNSARCPRNKATNSGLWRTRYALEDELKLHEVSECDGQRLTPTQVRALDALMNGASQADAAEAAGKSARWLWTQLNEGGEFLNAYRHAVQSLQKQSQLTALQRARDVMDVVTSIAVDRKHKDCLKAAQLILQLHKR